MDTTLSRRLPRLRLDPRKSLRRLWAVHAIFLQDALAYRSVAVIWIMTDTIPMLVMPLIWLAVLQDGGAIQGLGASEITAYYLVMLTVTNFIQCHVMWDMAQDIKEGRFSVALIRPFSYVKLQYIGFLSWRLMRTVLFLPLLAIAVYLFRDTLQIEGLQWQPAFFAAVLLGHFVSFYLTYALGLLALHFVEVRSFFNFYYMPLIVFSGQLAPLAFFPGPVRTLAEWLPFRYTLALPTEILLGLLSPRAVAVGLAAQVAWIVLFYVAGLVLWRTGLKRYTGVGI